MPARLTLFPSEGPSRSFVLEEGREHLAGRDPSCPIRLEDPRVSARHALLRWQGGAWTILDLGSKNGTLVNGTRATEALADEDWLSFGGLLARFEIVSDEEARTSARERAARLETSAEIRREIGAAADARAVLRRLVESAVSVVGAGRGFVLLVAPDGGVHGEVAAGAAAGEDFRGSFGAIEKALASGEAVVAADARSDAFLGRRRSVAEMGIGALACVPLRADGRVEGVLYVDGPGRGPFTDLDVEILEALADHAALVLAGMEIHRRIRDLSESGSGSAAPAERAILRELAARFGSSPPSRSGGPRIGNA